MLSKQEAKDKFWILKKIKKKNNNKHFDLHHNEVISAECLYKLFTVKICGKTFEVMLLLVSVS